jgi:hypothetical protein
MIEIKIRHLKEIARLSNKTIPQLRKLNPERAFNSRKLTKYQLIYQIVFLQDSPDND